MQQAISLLLVFLFVSFTNSHAQTTITMAKGKIDYVENVDNNYRTMSFLKNVKKNNCIESELSIEEGIPSTESEEQSTQKAMDFSDYIPIDSIKSLRIKDWEKLLDKKSFVLNQDDEKLITFSIQNDAVACIAEYDYNIWYGDSIMHPQYNYPYNDISTTFYNYAYLKLNKDKYIVLLLELDGDDNASINTIMPFADSLRVMEYKTSYDTPYSEEISSNWECIKELDTEDAYNIKPTKKGKYELTTKFHMSLPIKADSIILGDKYIISYDKRNQLYTFHNSLAQPLDIPKVRAYVQKNKTQVLVNNAIAWLDGDTLTNTQHIQALMVCGTVALYKDSLYVHNGDFYLHSYTDNSMIAREDVARTYKITNAEDVDSIYFHDRRLTNRYSANDRSDANNHILFVKKKSGKYNICTYITEHSDSTLTLQYQLDEDCDSLTMRVPSIFFNKGLSGYYPVMKKATYQRIGNVIENFLRYTKPNIVTQKKEFPIVETISLPGESGWLQINTMKEYPDQRN